jgi:hypothetical protein
MPRSSILVRALSSDPSMSPSTGPSRISLSRLSPSAANDRLLSPTRLVGRVARGPRAVASLFARPLCGDRLLMLTLRFVGDVARCWLWSWSRCCEISEGWWAARVLRFWADCKRRRVRRLSGDGGGFSVVVAVRGNAAVVSFGGLGGMSAAGTRALAGSVRDSVGFGPPQRGI